MSSIYPTLSGLAGTKKLPQSEARIKSGVIRGARYVVEVDVPSSYSGHFFFLERKCDGGANVKEADIVRTSTGIVASADIDDSSEIEKVHLLYENDGILFRVQFKTSEYFLDRLVSLDEKSIVWNIRWSNKISDYETLIFSAKQSFGVLKDPRLKLYCLLPIAYQALEFNDELNMAWSRTAIQECEELFARSLSNEALISFLTVQWHYYLMDRSVENLILCLERINSLSQKIDDIPLSTYNAIRAILLLAFMYQKMTKTESALAAYRNCINLFKLAVPRFAGEALNMFRELRDIQDCAFQAVIGINQLLDKATTGYSIDERSVARRAIRVRSSSAQERLIKNFQLIVGGIS